jgi:hypothetical protein
VTLVVAVTSVSWCRCRSASCWRWGGAPRCRSSSLFSVDLHRVLARRAADHRAVHVVGDAAAVPAGGVTFDKLLRALIGVALFSSAYMAEVVRGGLQASPRGSMRRHGAGLTFWQGRMMADHPAAGAEAGHSGHRQHLHRPVQGHNAGAHHRPVRPARDPVEHPTRTGFPRASRSTGLSLPRSSSGSSVSACRATPCSWNESSTPATNDQKGMAGNHQPAWLTKRSAIRKEPQGRSLKNDRVGNRCRDRDHRHEQVVRRFPRAARHQPEGDARRAHRHCGPSGSGKSTMIRCINRLEEHQKGKIIVDGIELTNDLKKIDEIRREVGMVFQHFNLFPHLTILENCTLAPIWVRKMPKKEAEESRCTSWSGSRSPSRQQVSRPAVGRSAAARGHRALAVHEPAHHAVRRADLGARSGNDQGSARRDGGPRRRPA